MADTTAPHHERDVRVGGQALTSNVDRASVPGDGSAGVEGGQPGPGAGVEAAAVDLQNLDDLPADLVDQPAARGPAGGDGRSRAQHAVEVPLLLARPSLFATAPWTLADRDRVCAAAVNLPPELYQAACSTN
jgi:hypothetical protein